MAKTVVIIGTLDTKGVEIAYLRDRLQALGLNTIVVDSGILGEPLGITLDPERDISRAKAAEYAGTNIDALRNAGSRGKAVEKMREALKALTLELYSHGRLDAITSMGGAEGAVMGAAARAFRDFDVERVARFGEDDVARLLADAGIVRNEAKIRSAIGNARAALEVIDELGSLGGLLWGFVDGRPRQNSWRSAAEMPSQTVESDALSAELRRRGVAFVGSTACYAFMQAVGMVNDHIVPCFRHPEVAVLAK